MLLEFKINGSTSVLKGSGSSWLPNLESYRIVKKPKVAWHFKVSTEVHIFDFEALPQNMVINNKPKVLPQFTFLKTNSAPKIGFYFTLFKIRLKYHFNYRCCRFKYHIIRQICFQMTYHNTNSLQEQQCCKFCVLVSAI